MIKVNIISNKNDWRKNIKNPSKLIKGKIDNLNKNYKKYKKNIFSFTLLLSGDYEIKKLNKSFRKKNKTTDVLSFPFYNKKDFKKKIVRHKEIYLGDVIINMNKIKHLGKKKNFILELDKLWVHGLVHLFGYDHKKNVDFYNMQRIEKKFLSYLK